MSEGPDAPGRDGQRADGLGLNDPVLEYLAEEPEGGDAACWAHLVCPECGAMSREEHRPDCAAAPPGPSRA
jgi:hypothetical protein